MPSRKSPKKSRKRKHSEIQSGSENDETSLKSARGAKRRRISKQNSPTKKKKHISSKSPSKSSKKRKSSKEERDSDSSSSSDNEQKSLDLQHESHSESQSQRKRSRNKNRKPLKRKRVSPKKHLRLSLSQRHSQSQSASINANDHDFELVQHNERVMEMYKWLTSSHSWMDIKNTLQQWTEDESDSQETENYAELTLDIMNLILYCGGVRVFKLEDINDLDIDSLTNEEREDLVSKLQEALMVDHEDIEALPEDSESEEEDETEHEAHSEEEKAEEENRKKKGKKEGVCARTKAEQILEFDVMLWRNGSSKRQNSFKSRYVTLMQKIGQIFQVSIFENDDYIITCILNWCEFFSRSFKLTQFRRVGSLTAFSLCDPLIKCMAKNRKPMEKIKEQLERETLLQENNNNNNKKKRKKSKKKVKETERMKKWRENIEEYRNKIDNLWTHIEFMMDKIACYKAGDSNESMRCLALEHIVKCINMDASTDSLLRNKYWQYLYYGLQDKSSKVRETSLLQLMELFDYQQKFHGKKRVRNNRKQNKNNENIIRETESDKLDENRRNILDSFWDRIKGCINSLLKDKNENVVTRCIQFVNILLRGDMLGANDGDCILNYIFDESDEIRSASAKFIFYDTFDVQAVLKSHVFDDDEEEKKDSIRIKNKVKMKDDIVEIIQLMKDRVVDLNIKMRQLINSEKKKKKNNNNNNINMMKENELYRNYVQVADYIVHSMKNELNVLREWHILFEILRDADDDKEMIANNKDDDNNDNNNNIQEMNIKHCIDDEGQTMLCYLILSCVKCVCNKLDSECRNVKAKRGRKTKENEAELRLNAMNSLKECILPHIAVLLDIYQADVFKLYPLIQIIHLIPIDAFNGVKNKTYLDDILSSLKKIFLRHDTPLINNSNNNNKYIDNEIKQDADDDERRNKELKELRQCIKTCIDNELITEIGKCLSYLCDKQYQFKESSGRFVFDIVSEIMDEFGDIMNKIESQLADDSVIESNLLQSLYSNLHKQYSLKCTMDVGSIKFTNSMHVLLRNIYDKSLYDCDECLLSNMLYRLLSTEISRGVNELNFVSPDFNKLHDLTQQKEELFKLLQYYVQRHTDDNTNLYVLDIIASIMETLCYFRGMKNQSQLLDDTLNNASFIEMEPVQNTLNTAAFNEISILKSKLYKICQYVFNLALIEDPYDPSAHITRENIQIRFLVGFARLCILNPTYYKQFGAIILSFYHRTNCHKRRDEIIKQIAHKLMQQNATQFEEILFEAIKLLMIKARNNEMDAKMCHGIIEKITKSVSMMKGLVAKNRRARKSWSVFTKLMMNFICGEIESIPANFVYLHCLTFFFRHFTNRDKLEIWAHFKSLTRKMPQNNDDNNNNKEDEKRWILFDKFKEKLKYEADKAQKNRNLKLDEDDLENLDLKQNENENDEILQSGSINVEMQNINIGIEIDERISVAKHNNNNNNDSRVSVAKKKTSDDEEEEDDDDIDINEAKSPKQKRKSPAGKWLKRLEK